MESNELDVSKKLKDLSFIRRALVAVLGYYHENIYYDWIENGKIVRKHVPISFDKSGDSQFIEDNFFDKDLDCDNILVNGDINVVPSATLLINSISISTDGNLNSLNEAYRGIETDGEWFKEIKSQSTRVDIIPIEFTARLSVKVNSILQSFLISESLIDFHHRVRIVLFEFDGFTKIPVEIEMGTKLSKQKKMSGAFTSPDKKEPIEFDVTLRTYKYVRNRVTNYNKTMEKYTNTITPNNTDK